MTRPHPGGRTVALRFLAVALLVALDLWSKQAAFAWLEGHPRPEALAYDQHGHARFRVLGEWLALMTSRNAGVAFGRLDAYPHAIVIGRGLAVLFLGWLLVRSASSRILALALVLILAGALGNLHDNLMIDDPGYPFGRVRDFIDVYFARWDRHFPTFNVADSCISVGAVMLFLSSFLPGDSEHPG